MLTSTRIISITFVLKKLNSYPTIGDQATAKCYGDQSIVEPILVKINKRNDFNHYSSSNISQITLSSEPIDDNHVATKSSDDSLSENERDEICH